VTIGALVGTAGHVDHGKSALVEALTGMRADRLAEERRRGLTIELEHAVLDLSADGGGSIGVLECPDTSASCARPSPVPRASTSRSSASPATTA